MFNKILKNSSSDEEVDKSEEIQQFFDDIAAKKKEIADNKAKIKEEHSRGARITKHRFTI